MKLTNKFLSGLVLAASVSAVSAGTNSGTLNGNMNYTIQNGGSFSSNGGVGYQFGGFHSRLRTENIRPMSWQRPTFSAGCSGLSFNGGALKLIKGSEFIERLKENGKAGVTAFAQKVVMTTASNMIAGILNDLDAVERSMNALAQDRCFAFNALDEQFKQEDSSRDASAFLKPLKDKVAQSAGDDIMDYEGEDGDSFWAKLTRSGVGMVDGLGVEEFYDQFKGSSAEQAARQSNACRVMTLTIGVDENKCLALVAHIMGYPNAVDVKKSNKDSDLKLNWISPPDNQNAGDVAKIIAGTELVIVDDKPQRIYLPICKSRKENVDVNTCTPPDPQDTKAPYVDISEQHAANEAEVKTFIHNLGLRIKNNQNTDVPEYLLALVPPTVRSNLASCYYAEFDAKIKFDAADGEEKTRRQGEKALYNAMKSTLDVFREKLVFDAMAETLSITYRNIDKTDQAKTYQQKHLAGYNKAMDSLEEHYPVIDEKPAKDITMQDIWAKFATKLDHSCAKK